MLNKGFRNENKVELKDCDFLYNLLLVKDIVVRVSEDAKGVWDTIMECDWPDANDIKKIILTFDFLYLYNAIEDDVITDGLSASYTDSKDKRHNDNIPMGFCKDTFGTGLPSIGFEVRSDDTMVTVYKLCYFDGEKFKIFTPYEGNCVNIITHTAIGDELVLEDDELEDLCNTELSKQIFGANTDTESLLDEEEYPIQYIKYFNPEFEVDECFEYTRVDPDLDTIEMELKEAIIVK